MGTRRLGRETSVLLALITSVAFCGCEKTEDPTGLPGNPDDSSADDSLGFMVLWEYSSLPSSSFSIEYDALDRPYFYATAKEGGLLIFDASTPQQTTLVGTLPISDLQSLHVMNVFQQGNYVYLALGGHFGGQSELGLGIIDVSDPPNASVADVWRLGPGKGSAIVIVDGDYAYLGAMTLGLMIFDVADKADIQLVSQFVPDIDFPKPDPVNAQTFNARGMDLDNNTVYLAYDAGGLRIIDVSDKSSPVETGRYINTAVEPMAYNNIALDGDLAYIAIDYCGLEVLDVSDPVDITQVSWWNHWECAGPLDWFNSEGHTNEVIIRGDLAFLSSADSELSVVDISDPLQPRLHASFGEPGNSQGTWGLEVHGQQVLLTYIRTLGIPFRSTWGGIKLLEGSF